jgi:hypothetical protein
MAGDGRLIVMHLHDRKAVDSYHRGVGGSVARDFLPDDRYWEDWLAAAGFCRPEICDGQDGFFLRAVVD